MIEAFNLIFSKIDACVKSYDERSSRCDAAEKAETQRIVEQDELTTERISCGQADGIQSVPLLPSVTIKFVPTEQFSQIQLWKIGVIRQVRPRTDRWKMGRSHCKGISEIPQGQEYYNGPIDGAFMKDGKLSVIGLQQWLSANNYDPGPIDAEWGDRTAKRHFNNTSRTTNTTTAQSMVLS